MKKIFFLTILIALFGLFASASDVYVDPNGNDSNPGTLGSPLKSLRQAILQVSAGDHIYLRGGIYYESTSVTINRGNDGTLANPKFIEAYGTEVPILNFSAQAELSTNRGLTINGNFWYVKGVIVEEAGDNGIFIGGNNNTIDKCITRRNKDTGLQLGRYSSTALDSEWPSYNLMVDCESYDNKDIGNENADGFACKLTTGPGNIFRRCIAHHNIDDGWDLYTKTETGPIGAVLLEDCIAHSNGVLTTGTSSGNGDKNGFKLGGEGIPVNHIVRRCIAFNNGKHGFTYNSNPGSIEMTNCTGYNNAQRNFSFDIGTHVYKNNLSYKPASNDKVIGSTPAPNAFSNDVTWPFKATAATFFSLTPGPNSNPTLNGFLHLAAGNNMIDAGAITPGIDYKGTAPDLGAVETDGTTPPPPANFQLTTAVTGQGTVNPSSGTYTSGATVAITATPAAGYVFSSWSGDATGNTNPLTVTMSANKNIVANFTINGGTPTGNTVRIDNTATTATGLCSYDGSFRAVGAVNVINLSNTAAKGVTWKVEVPAAGSYMLAWRYAGGGSSAQETARLIINGTMVSETVPFPKPASSTAFLTTQLTGISLGNGVNEIRIEAIQSLALGDIEWIEVTGTSPIASDCSAAIGSGGGGQTVTYQLATTVNGQGSVAPASGSFNNGAVANLTATPDAGWQFDGWSGDATGNSNPLALTMNANKSITANFSLIPVTVSYQISTSVNGQGSVSPASGSFNDGTTVNLTATPDAGWQFDGWDGDATGNANPLSITMSSNKAVIANFSLIPVSITYQLTTAVNGQGSVTPQGGSFNQGALVTLTATPAAGWQFDGWSGDASGTTNPLTITMDANKSISAVFSNGTIPTPDFSMIGFATVSGEGYTTTTGGQGGDTVRISTLAALQTWATSRENKTTPEIVLIYGKISAPSTTVVTIKHGANVSVFGVGSTSELQNVGLNFRNYKNIIVRNLKIHEVFYPNDGLTIDECQHVWVDHNELYSKIGAGIGVDTYDGLLDIKNGSRYVTVSWNHFHHHMKNILIGHTDNSGAEATDRQIRVTFHHNYFQNTDGRNPSLRWGAAHMFNNYLKDITDYGIAVRQGAHALLENNIYENVLLPISTNKFDGEGYACERGNLFTGTSGPNSITQTDCAFWDASSLPYSYTLDPVSGVSTVVPPNVGVGIIDINGGDNPPPPGSFQLTTAVTGQGTVNPATGNYADGSTATLTATPAAGYVFSSWSGDASGSTNPLTVTMDANKDIVANFTVSGGGPGGNTVRIDNTATTATGLCSYDGSLRLVGSVTVINLSNTATKGVTWKVEVPAAGVYSLAWRYAGGGSSAQETARLIINGTVVNDAVPFPKPASSSAFLTTELPGVNLGNGVNEIRIEAIQSLALGDIEWIEVTGVSPIASDCSAAIGSGGGGQTVTYQLATSVNGQGSLSPASGTFNSGAVANLNATPDAGWQFDGWSGDATGNSNPLVLTMDGNKSVTANFSQITYQLSTSVNGQGSLSPASGTFNSGGVANLTATPDAGWQFDGWSGDATGNSNPLVLTMDGNKSVTANFSQITYEVLTSVIGQGSLTPASGTVNAGSSVTFTATPAAGWKFDGWSGDAIGNSNPLTISIAGNTSVTANFSEIIYELITTVSGQGSLSVVGGNLTAGASVTLTATAADGWQFNGWSGDATGAANPLTITMDANKQITANFAPITYQLTTAVNGEGTVTPSSGGYNEGASVTVTATPANGWKFDGWSGDASGLTNPLAIVMNSNKAVVANFSRITYQLTTAVTGEGTVAPNAGTYNANTSATLTATPAAGWVFAGWSGDASGTTNPVTISMTSNKAVTANFTYTGIISAVSVYPVPFRGSATWEFTLTQKSKVTLALYAWGGIKVADIIKPNGQYQAGTHKVVYNNKSLKPGFYFYVLETENGRYTGQISVE